MTPVEGLRDKPVGRDPDEVENDKSSPLIEGEIENGSYLDRVYEDSGYENEVMRVRTLNVRVTF